MKQIGIIILIVSALSNSVFAQGSDHKVSASNTSSASARVKLSDIRVNPQKYSGQTVSLVGYLDGLITSSNGVTIIFRAPEGDKIFARVAGSIEQVQPGSAVQVDVKVPANSGYVESLELINLRSVPPPKPVASPAAAETPSPRGLESATGTTSARGAGTANSSESQRQAGKDAHPSQSKTAVGRNKSLPSRAASSPIDRAVSAMLPDYKRIIKQFNPRLEDARLTQIAEAVLRFSLQNQIDPRLTVAVIAVESNFHLEATSHSGAMGLGQLMPGTAAGMGVSNPYDPVENIQAAVRLISGHLKNYRNNPDGFYRALAAYNAGSGAVRRFGGIPPYQQTINYIWKIYNLYRQLAPDQFK